MHILMLSLVWTESYMWASTATCAPTLATMLQNDLTRNLPMQKKNSVGQTSCMILSIKQWHVMCNSTPCPTNWSTQVGFCLMVSQLYIYITMLPCWPTYNETLIVCSNGSSRESHMVGHFVDINVWYNSDSLANILSLTQIRDKFRVMMDSERESMHSWYE